MPSSVLGFSLTHPRFHLFKDSSNFEKNERKLLVGYVFLVSKFKYRTSVKRNTPYRDFKINNYFISTTNHGFFTVVRFTDISMKC